MLESQVAHHRANHGPLEAAFPLARGREDIKQLITIDDGTILIDHDQAIAIAIQRHTDVSFEGRNRQAQELGVCRAAAFIDVAPVRRATDRDYVRAEITDGPRPYLVARTVGAIENDLETIQCQVIRKRRGAELLVANPRRINALGFAKFPRLARNRTLL